MADQASADAVLRAKHTYKQSDIDVKPALDREQARNKADAERQRKIFAGGLPKNMSDERLKDYFSKFGSVLKCYVVKDSFSGKTRGFGFVIYEHEGGYQGALAAADHWIDGQEIHIKPAQTKAMDSPPTQPQSMSPAAGTDNAKTPKSKGQGKKKGRGKDSTTGGDNLMSDKLKIPSPQQIHSAQVTPKQAQVTPKQMSITPKHNAKSTKQPAKPNFPSQSQQIVDSQPQSHKTQNDQFSPVMNYQQCSAVPIGYARNGQVGSQRNIGPGSQPQIAYANHPGLSQGSAHSQSGPRSFRGFNLYGQSGSGRLIMHRSQLPSKPVYQAGDPYTRPIVDQGQNHSQPTYSPHANAMHQYNNDYEHDNIHSHVVRMRSSQAVGHGGMYSEYMQTVGPHGPAINSAVFAADNNSTYNGQLHSLQAGLQIRSLHDIYPQRRTQPFGYGSSKFQPVVSNNASPVANVTTNMSPQNNADIQSFPQGKRNFNYALNPFVPNEEDTEDDHQLERVTEF